MSVAPEILEIRNLARDFASAELRPHTEEWDAGAGFDAALPAKIAELGFFGMLLAEDAGGMGFDLATYTAALEELAWGEAGAALLVAENVIAADVIARSGDNTLREQWLAQLTSGAVTACFADAADARVSDGSISGHARFVVNGARARLCIVSAGGQTYVTDAFTADTAVAPLGLRTIGVAALTFDGSVTALATQTGETAAAALSIAAIATGIAQAALEHALRYASEREQFGKPIREFEGIQSKFAEMATRIAAARALVERAAADPTAQAVAMAKLNAATGAMFVTTEAVQIFGGYGYMRDYPVEKLMRDAKAMELLHGSNETQRARIAEALYA